MSKSLLEKSKYYDKEGFQLFFGDTFALLRKMAPSSVDMIFADPPYFLSSDGITCKSGKMESVNKADWDVSITVNEKLRYNQLWIRLCKRVLKDNGTIWISGTLHNIYTIGVALEREGFKIINNITWQKTNPPPNIACRTFVHSTETILWAKKVCKAGKHLFNYELMKAQNGDKQMKDVWTFPLISPSEKACGFHPTQKPLSVLRRILLASTDENMTVLDPFCGSGTTGIASAELNRKFIGIDNVQEYLDIAVKRYESGQQKTLLL